MINNKAYRFTQIVSFIAISASTLLILPVEAAILQITYEDIANKPGANLINFEGLTPGFYNETITRTGSAGLEATFGQNFAGQTVGVDRVFDTLSGTPTDPLTVVPGATNRNLSIDPRNRPDGTLWNVLNGLGPASFPPNSRIVGEGAVSVLLQEDQSEFGFFVVDGNGDPISRPENNLFVSFFKRDGSLIESFDIFSAKSTTGSVPYGFRVESGEAIIAGVSIYNKDFEGLGFADFISREETQQPIPEPSSWLGLLAVGMVGVASTVLKSRVK